MKSLPSTGRSRGTSFGSWTFYQVILAAKTLRPIVPKHCTAPVPELKGVCEKRNCNITVVMIYILWSCFWSGLMLHFLRFSTQPTRGEQGGLIDILIGISVFGFIIRM